MALVGSVVEIVPTRIYRAQREEAQFRLKRDPTDWHILALALTLQCEIWTEDNDFCGIGVPVWNTHNVDRAFLTPE